MTLRRWQRALAEDDEGAAQAIINAIGPLEVQVRAELETLGWTPLCGPGPLAVAAARACLMAETYDRTQNAANLPALDRAVSEAMREARLAALGDPARDKGGTTEQPPEGAGEEDVDDFTRRRRERGSDPPPVGGAATP